MHQLLTRPVVDLVLLPQTDPAPVYVAAPLCHNVSSLLIQRDNNPLH